MSSVDVGDQRENRWHLSLVGRLYVNAANLNHCRAFLARVEVGFIASSLNKIVESRLCSRNKICLTVFLKVYMISNDHHVFWNVAHSSFHHQVMLLNTVLCHLRYLGMRVLRHLSDVVGLAMTKHTLAVRRRISHSVRLWVAWNRSWRNIIIHRVIFFCKDRSMGV